MKQNIATSFPTPEIADYEIHSCIQLKEITPKNSATTTTLSLKISKILNIF